MAKISTIKQMIKVCGEAGITLFIWGHRGMGKSSLCAQVSAEQGWGFIDLRCSQLEAADIRGLPDRVDGRTKYLPPSDMPIGDWNIEKIKAHLGEPPVEGKDREAYQEQLRQYLNKEIEAQSRFQNGILLLDELNRAQDDVLQAVFQLVLDKRIGQYALPPGWFVVIAGNFNEGYQTTGFQDPAFLDRFCHTTLSSGESTLEEWVQYITSVQQDKATEVIEFAAQNVDHLDGKVEGDLGFSVQPSRRSWEMVIKARDVIARGNYSSEVETEVLAGLIGRDLALAFMSYSCPVKPRDLINRGVKAMQKELKALKRNELVGLMWGLVSFTRDRIDDDNVATVCLDFAEHMCKHAEDKDVVVAFCRSMVKSKDNEDDRNRTAVISNWRLAKMMADFEKKSGNGKKSFLVRLTEREELQKLLSKTAWGSGDDDK